MPQKIIDATAYMALQHINSALDATLDRGGDVRRQRVGSLEIEYMDSAKSGVYRPYARRIVHGLYKHAPGAVALKRA